MQTSMKRTQRRASLIHAVIVLLVAPGAALAQSSAGSFQTSFEAGQPQAKAAAQGRFSVSPAGGPDKSVVLTAKPNVGFTGVRSLRFAGSAGGRQSVRLFETDVPIKPDTQLSYLIFPQRVKDDLRNPSNYVAVDLLFDDGSRLSTTAALDQHRDRASARGQGEGRVLYPNQWNRVVVDLGTVAAGRHVKAILLDHDGPAAPIAGYLDDLRVGPAPLDTRSDPADFVDTRRGSNANGQFSRGNTFPAVALPHGFNFWTPVTDAGSNWLYHYQDQNGADNRPRIEAFSLSHEPSPWMGDRQTFQIMPETQASGVPVLDRRQRALSFSHAHETARADAYRVTFDNGLVAQMTPTDHAAMMAFTFPGDRGQLLLDNVSDDGAVTIDPDQRSFSGYSDENSARTLGASRMFFVGQVDQPVIASGRFAGSEREHVAAWLGFDTRTHKTVTVRIATSLISIAQARHNLALEIAPTDTFASVRARARKAWNAVLEAVQVEGASAPEKTTLYSNLYRLFLYPNEAFENTGSMEKPDYRYASPFSPATGKNTPTRSGARIVAGQPYVNNGFWDTYRTAWPAYSLLTPLTAGRMIDGFVQQFRDGGWIARWSSPGYADVMVGTSADVAFADAWLKGVHNFDVRAFYQSALKDATVVSPNPAVGRKGMAQSIFDGYTNASTPEGLSWSSAGYLNDFGIGNLAAALAKNPPANDPYASHYADDARYFRNRALAYVNLFNPAIGFFVGRKRDGSWLYTPQSFNPIRWGGSYTETDGWNMAFDPVQDGQGLAALYGGRVALAAKLDRFFATPGNFDVGSYGQVIHEMREARDVRMGQYGHSNQPSHHIIYMYDQAGQPWKVQDKVRDVLRREYVGSSIGQGYPGDEDNGEMSAWYIFSAAGFYPLRMGTPAYVIGAPYFPHMTLHLQSGKSIVINAPAVSDSNRYVQSLTVNGKPWNALTLPHALLAAGARLDFVMGPKPSRWASAESAMPPSLTVEGKPEPLRDLSDTAQISAAPDIADLAALTDNDSSTEAAIPAGGATISWRFKNPQMISMLTLTSAVQGQTPVAWMVRGSSDGTHWTTLDQRRDQRFPWPQQTRAFSLKTSGDYAWYRLQFEPSDKAAALGEIELIGKPAAR